MRRFMLAHKKAAILLLTGATVIAGLFAYVRYTNSHIVVRRYTLPCQALPPAFDGFTIVQISDLHGNTFGDDQQDLINLIREQNPDIIVLTGDMVDGRRKEFEPAESLFRQIPAIAPCYSISGNHEWYLTPAERRYLNRIIKNAGIVSLDDAGVILGRAEASMLLCGLDDPSHILYGLDLTKEKWKSRMKALYQQALNNMNLNRSPMTEMAVLLCHNPVVSDMATAEGWDAVLSGHNHGGQIGLPGDRGLLSPDGGLFGRAAGALAMNEGWSVISRGMGNSVFPIRIACPMELVVITLTLPDEA